jgi:polyhydroxyalkanoate synthesis regulator phasin
MLDIDPSFRLLFGIDENTNLAEDMIAKINVEIEDDGKTGEERALEHSRELVKWIEDNDGEMPNYFRKRLSDLTEEEKCEQKHYTFFCNMKNAKKGTNRGVIYPSTEKIFIDYFGENWFMDKRNYEELQFEKMTKVKEWVLRNNKKPRESFYREPVTEEEKLGIS